MSEPIGIIGRTHYACFRCKSQKVKCSGSKPACSSCLASNAECVYPIMDRKLIVLESQWLNMQQRIRELERQLGYSDITPSEGVRFDLNRLSVNDDSKPQNFYVDDDLFKASYIESLSLPPRRYALESVRLAIEYFNQSHYMWDPEEFRECVTEMYDTSTYRSSDFLSQFWITMALGEVIKYSLNPSIKPQSTPGLRFFFLAAQFYPQNETPSVMAVQVAILFGYYLQTLNRMTTAYTYFGTAVRWCVSQGWHLRNSSVHNGDVVLMEKRRRVWWTSFVFDSFASTRLRVPVQISYEMCECGSMREHPVDLKDGFKSAMLANQVALLRFSNVIVSKVYRVDNLVKLAANTLETLTLLETHFERNLKPEFTRLNVEISKGGSTSRCLVHLFLKFNHYVILTSRPLIIAIFKGLIKEDKTTLRITKKCILSACHSVDLLYSLKDGNQLLTYDYWDNHFCFNAIMILEMAVSTGKSYEQIDKGVALLKYMASKGNHVAIDNFNKLAEMTSMFEGMGIRMKTTIPLVLDPDVCLIDVVPPRNIAINTSDESEVEDVVLEPRTKPGQQLTNTLSYLSDKMDIDLSNERYHFTPVVKQEEDAMQVFKYEYDGMMNNANNANNANNGNSVQHPHNYRSFDDLFGNFSSWDVHNIVYDKR